VEGVGSVGGEVGPAVEEEHWAESWVGEEVVRLAEDGVERRLEGF
jgi:hypothetical protein